MTVGVTHMCRLPLYRACCVLAEKRARFWGDLIDDWLGLNVEMGFVVVRVLSSVELVAVVGRASADIVINGD